MAKISRKYLFWIVCDLLLLITFGQYYVVLGQEKGEQPIFCSSCPLQCQCKNNATCDPMTGNCTNGACKNGPGLDTATIFPNIDPGCQLSNRAFDAGRGELLPVTDGNTMSCGALGPSTFFTISQTTILRLYDVYIISQPANNFTVKPVSWLNGAGDGLDNAPDCQFKNQTAYNNYTKLFYDCQGNGAQRFYITNSNSLVASTTVCEIVIYGGTPLNSNSDNSYKSNCEDGTWNYVIGCTECVTGKTGRPYCNITCSNQTYGTYCSKNCSKYCASIIDSNQSCDPSNGTCSDGCTPFWSGPMCSTFILDSHNIIIIVCVIVGGIIFIVIIVLVVTCIKRKKQEDAQAHVKVPKK